MTTPQDGAGTQPGEVRSSDQLGLADRLRHYAGTNEHPALRLQCLPRGVLLNAADEMERLSALADSEGTRAVECLRRARKAEGLLLELADACAEVSDLTPQAFRDRVLKLGARARVMLTHRSPLMPLDPRARAGKPPCGECHIQPGERCDICGAQEA